MKTSLIFILIIMSFGCNKHTTKSQTKEKEEKNNIVENNNRFALELYSNIKENNKNIIFSPYSISSALAMTYAGAKKRTKEQMSSVMHFYPEQDSVNKDFNSITNIINNINAQEGIELNIANSLWAQKDLSLKIEYKNVVEKNYNAKIQEVDFVGNTEKSRILINDWVAKKTNQKIKDLIVPGIIDASTTLVLTNAIYFFGAWEKPFKKDDSFDGDFFTAQKTSEKATFMKQKEKFRYFENNSLQVLELPYSNEKLSMLVFLPRKKQGLENLLKSLDFKTYKHIIDSLQKMEVKIRLPRFKITSDFQLSKVLIQMGMKDAFSGVADFSGMTGKKDMFIDEVIHKAFIEVNEKGTEAAAATAVIMRKTAILHCPEFYANHPFLYFIKDNQTGSILFMGHIINPVEE